MGGQPRPAVMSYIHLYMYFLVVLALVLAGFIFAEMWCVSEITKHHARNSYDVDFYDVGEIQNEKQLLLQHNTDYFYELNEEYDRINGFIVDNKEPEDNQIEKPDSELEVCFVGDEPGICEQKFPPNDYSTLIDISSFNFILEPKSCNPKSTPHLITFVYSLPGNSELRLAIRETWGSSKFGARIIFVMGTTPEYDKPLLELEHIKYKDIVLGNFQESFRNLTYKHVMALKWITYNCPRVKYAIKTEDDSFLNMVNLRKKVVRLPRTDLIFCAVKENSPVIKENMNGLHNKERKNTKDPKYCFESGIVYSGDVVRKLYVQAQKAPFFWMENVHITGTLAKQLHIKHVPANDARVPKEMYNNGVFINGWPKDSEYIFGPFNVNADNMRYIFDVSQV